MASSDAPPSPAASSDEEEEEAVPTAPPDQPARTASLPKSHMQDSFRDYLTVKKSQIIAKWTRDDGEATCIRSERRTAREFRPRRILDPNPPPPRKAPAPAKPPPDDLHVQPSAKMPGGAPEWVQRQVQIWADERLSAPRPDFAPEPPTPERTGSRAWMAFVVRQSKSEKVRHQNRNPATPKKRVPVDGPVFERLYGRSLRKEDEEQFIPTSEPRRKSVWSNAERLVKPRHAEEPPPPEPYPREKRFLKKSQRMAMGKPGLADRAKRDFKDMIEEYRAGAREERLRNEYSGQFQ